MGSASKSKNKQKEARHSRSRNTTPSSVLSASANASAPSTTPFLQFDTSKLLVSSQPSYAEILDRLEIKPSNLEPRQLQDIIEQIKQLNDSAEKRIDSCEKAIRVIHDQLKDLDSEHKERERQAEQVRRIKARKEDASSQKNNKAKKRKDRDAVEVEIKREGMLIFFVPASRPLFASDHLRPFALCITASFIFMTASRTLSSSKVNVRYRRCQIKGQ